MRRRTRRTASGSARCSTESHGSRAAGAERLSESHVGTAHGVQVQRLSEFDGSGRSLRAEWQTIIDDATKRLGGTEDSRCRVTVTDKFGGRGHDFQVVDKEANANGGMLVIATSIPDEREWIQWKGRTARQDRPIVTVVVDAVSAVRIADVVVRKGHATCPPHSFLCSAIASTAVS